MKKFKSLTLVLVLAICGLSVASAGSAGSDGPSTQAYKVNR